MLTQWPINGVKMVLYDYLDRRGCLRKIIFQNAHMNFDEFSDECERIHKRRPHNVVHEYYAVQTFVNESYSKGFCKCSPTHKDAKPVTVGYY